MPSVVDPVGLPLEWISEMENTKLAKGNGCQTMQDYVTSLIAQLKLLLAFAANFTDMCHPHWGPDDHSE